MSPDKASLCLNVGLNVSVAFSFIVGLESDSNIMQFTPEMRFGTSKEWVTETGMRKREAAGFWRLT